MDGTPPNSADPFAPTATPSAVADGPPCPACGNAMDAAQASYDDRGQLVCRKCTAARTALSASELVKNRDPTSTTNLYGAGAASALLGVVTCSLSGMGPFFFIATPLAMAIGSATLYNLMRHPEARKQLGAGTYLVAAGAVAGILFGLIGTGLGIIGLAL